MGDGSDAMDENFQLETRILYETRKFIPMAVGVY